MKQIIFGLLFLPFINSCTQKPKTANPSNYKSDISICEKSLYIDTTIQKSGPIKLELVIQSILIGKDLKSINKKVIIDLDHESDLIRFEKIYGLKFYHVEAFELGRIVHLVKCDFFNRTTEKGCWERYSFNYSEVRVGDKSQSSPSHEFSIGSDLEAEKFLEVTYLVKRIE